MRYKLKCLIVYGLYVLVWPLGVPSRLAYQFFGSEAVFEFSAKLLCLLPGKVGQYLRAAFYKMTLAGSHCDLMVGFGSFFAHPTARVGRKVGMGSFTIIGTAVIGDGVMIGSRVSVLSGKYQHGSFLPGASPGQAARFETVTIGAGTWIGEGAIVMASLGRHCMVSAGSVVTKPAPDRVVAVGNPARFLKGAEGGEGAQEGLSAGTAGKALLAALALGLCLATATGETMADSKRVVYIEASTVNGWKLDGFAARTGSERYRFEVLREYDFDKSKHVDQVVAGGSPPPDAVIVQECAVYFPGDLPAYQRLFRGWIEKLKARGLRPMIATVVPPAETRGGWQRAKAFVKQEVLGRPSRYEQVVAFNGWQRALGEELEVPVLDLEALLRKSDADRHMRSEYDAGDGIHLNRDAYDRLDRALLEFLGRHLR